jgi:hypothetical protein
MQLCCVIARLVELSVRATLRKKRLILSDLLFRDTFLPPPFAVNLSPAITGEKKRGNF